MLPIYRTCHSIALDKDRLPAIVERFMPTCIFILHLMLCLQKPTFDNGLPDQNTILTGQTGTIHLGDGLATMNLPDRFAFLNQNQEKIVLVDFWENPPTVVENIMGLVVPRSFDPTAANSWVVAVAFENEGYVSSEDARSLDYDQILSDLQQAIIAANVDRTAMGYGSMTLKGWAEEPFYNAAEHKLYWAKELRFDIAEEHTLNYDVRILGRRGFLNMQAVADMRQLGQIKPAMDEILKGTNFNDGHRYEDFDSKIDDIAAYGVGGLIAGKVAAKAGLFKVLFAILAKSGKLLLIGGIAVCVGLGKLFGRKDADT